MIEEIVRNYLLSALDVPVYIDVPSEPPESYVVIERTGGGETEHIREATIALQSYGSRRYDAAVLHEFVMGVMKDIIILDSISSCEINAEYDFTDISTKRFRYQAVYNIVYYGGLKNG